jgi:hypothetical protein
VIECDPRERVEIVVLAEVVVPETVTGAGVLIAVPSAKKVTVPVALVGRVAVKVTVWV